MGKKTIVGVGCELPGGMSESVALTEKRSLLDWDVVVFHPEVHSFWSEGEVTYQGRRRLADGISVALRERPSIGGASYWRPCK
jgi:hypothetical protein